jgi:DivIVA domain-containing protein
MTTPTSGDPLVPRRRRTGPVRLTPDLVRRLDFSRTPLGRRGYTEAEVERFRIRVVDEINRAEAEKAELRERIDRLHAYIKQHNLQRSGETGTVPPGLDGERPSVQAVNVLSQAQQAADQHIAQAEDYARHLVAEARQRYEQILATAHNQAAQAAEEAARAHRARATAEDSHREREELEAKIAYLRTFAQVTQVQLRSALAALGQELDKLTETPAVTSERVQRAGEAIRPVPTS